MIKTVTKRDGSQELFDFDKVVSAVEAAYDACNATIPETTIEKLKAITDLPDRSSVENIQDEIEKILIETDYEVGKAFMLYRYDHKLIRNKTNKFTRDISAKLRAENVENQNANVDEYSFGGRKGEALSIMLKKFALDNCMSKKSKRNHENNEIYIHDLDSYATGEHNCLSIPFDDLLEHGFTVRQTDIRPAKSIGTALQLVAVIFQVQSLQQFGGVSATHLDWTLVPYFRFSFFKNYVINYLKAHEEIDTILDHNVSADDLDDWIAENKEKFLRKFDLSYEDFKLENKDKFDRSIYNMALFDTRIELMQAVEGMYHNLNSLQSRSGNQLPFTSINYGTCTSPEGQLIIDALLEGSMRGVGKHHKTPIFPCGIFQYMKGVNDKPGTPNYKFFKKALQSTSQRLYPNYANVDWSGNAGYDRNDPRTYFSTMGCRTANGFDINHEPGQNPQTKDGRGNICPVTVIMPTLAMKANRDVEKFMKLLDKKIGEAKDMLLERFEYICSQSPKAASFMYGNNTMMGYKPEEGIRSALKHGTLALGQLGLNETLILLIGKNHTTEEGMALAKRIEELFKTRCAEFKEAYKLNFGVYYTPAENLCYTAMKKFRAKYGEIEGVSDKEYFTNSIHVPVYENMTAFEKIDIESQLTGYSSAGCITYVELPSGTKNNIEALEEIVNYAMEKDIPYFAINVPNDMCNECGYCDEMGDTCPECGSHDIQHLRRVTGYLTGDYKTAFNVGKQKETEQRVKHTEKEVQL